MNKWSPEEDAMLARVWPEMGQDCRHLFPGRSLSAIRTRANFLKIKRDGRKRVTAIRADKPEMVNVTRIEFPDDEPLVKSKVDRRHAVSCFGFIRGGRVSSVFDLAKGIA